MINFSDGTKCTFYQWFQIEPTATKEEIIRGYKRLAKVIHPDVNKPEDKEQAHKAFTILNNTKELLLDPVRREKYDILIGVKKPKPKPDGVFWSVKYYNWGDWSGGGGSTSSTAGGF